MKIENSVNTTIFSALFEINSTQNTLTQIGLCEGSYLQQIERNTLIIN